MTYLSDESIPVELSVEYSVVVFHEDYDHHPAELVETPLSVRLGNLKFILLVIRPIDDFDRCGLLGAVKG
ncbi:MAG: hypothetical protein ACLFVL_07870 [Candidatus Aenigmatarchaeota archaeon]